MAGRAETLAPPLEQVDELFMDYAVARQTERRILPLLKAACREYGNLSGAGLYADMRQGCYDQIHKPSAVVEAAVELALAGCDVPVEAQQMLIDTLKAVLACVNVKSLNNCYRGIPNWDHIRAKVEASDSDGGLTTYWGEAKIDVRATECGKGTYWHREEAVSELSAHAKGFEKDEIEPVDTEGDWDELDDDGTDYDWGDSEGLSPG